MISIFQEFAEAIHYSSIPISKMHFSNVIWNWKIQQMLKKCFFISIPLWRNSSKLNDKIFSLHSQVQIVNTRQRSKLGQFGPKWKFFCFLLLQSLSILSRLYQTVFVFAVNLTKICWHLIAPPSTLPRAWLLPVAVISWLGWGSVSIGDPSKSHQVRDWGFI